MRQTKRGGWGYSQPPNVPFELNKDSPQAKGLVLWLPLLGPRVIGTQRFVDRVQRRVLTSFNAPVWVQAGWMGNALWLDDAATKYLQSGSTPVAAVPLTLAGWGYSDDVAGGQDIIVCIGDADQLRYFAIGMHGGAAGDPAFAATDGVAIGTALSTTGATVNTWHHYCGVFPATNDRAAFIDGGSKGTENTDATPIGLDVVCIGARTAWGGHSQYWSGSIADIRIYNRALTDAEVYALYAPETRWELYKPLTSQVLGYAPAAVRVPRHGFVNFQVPGIL